MAWLKRGIPAPERGKPAVERSDPASEHSDSVVGHSDSAVKRGDPAPERGEPVVERGDPAVKRSDPAVGHSDPAPERGDLAGKCADPASRVLRVDGGRYRTIGAALGDARDGDVIEIAGGTYAERLLVEKAVELRPIEGTGAVGLMRKDGPLVLRASATVRDLMITVGGAEWVDALVISGPEAAPTVVGCVIGAGRGAAIQVENGASPVVHDCRIEGSRHSLVIEGAGGRYERCELADASDDAVVVRGGATPELAGCTVTRPGHHGFRVSGAGTILTLRKCLVDQAESDGVRVEEAGRAVLVGITLRNIRMDAVRVGERGSDVELTGCTISGGDGTGGDGTGVAVRDHARATLTDCAFAGLGQGVTVLGRTATASVTGGSFEDVARVAVACSDTSRAMITGVTVRRGAGEIRVSGRATLLAEDVTVEDAERAFLVLDGEGRYTRCRAIGVRDAGFALIDGRGFLDRCEAAGGHDVGFLVQADATATLAACVAHDNADSGFELNGTAELTACGSYANGEPDEVGVQEGAPVPADLPPAAVRIGRSMSAVRRFDEAVDELEEALDEVGALVEARFGTAGRAVEAERLIEELTDRVEALRGLTGESDLTEESDLTQESGLTEKDDHTDEN